MSRATRAPQPHGTWLAAGQPESPSVVDRALAILDDADRARADRLRFALARATEPTRAAILAYELGELHYRRFGDEDAALESFREAFRRDPGLLPNRWALRRLLYRRRARAELVEIADTALEVAATSERADLIFERAHLHDDPKRARADFEEVLRIEPGHQGALLAIAHIYAKAGPPARFLATLRRLAEASESPAQQVATWLEVARLDRSRAKDAVRAAAQLDSSPQRGETVARAQLQFADHDAHPEIIATLARLGSTLEAGGDDDLGADRAARERELMAIYRYHAQLVQPRDPAEAWSLLERAHTLAPDDPIVLSDMLRLAAELGRFKELLGLVGMWRAVETDAGRISMMAAWCAESYRDASRRIPWRVLRGALPAAAPGFILLTASAECDALADAPDPEALASVYLDAARAARTGTWIGPGAPLRPDLEAALALYLQAAELLGHHANGRLAQAREALAKAAEIDPDHPAVVESQLALEAVRGAPATAIDRLRAAGEPITSLDRAARIAAEHRLFGDLIELERERITREPTDARSKWRLVATLTAHGRPVERADVLAELASSEPPGAARSHAILESARLASASGDLAAATRFYRALVAIAPEERVIRDAHLDLLREQGLWEELVAARRAEADTTSDDAYLRRALREAAWLLEVRLGDVAGARELYERWSARMPEDRTALEGLARCCATLRDPQHEATARGRIADVDQTPEARWMHARSLERGGAYLQAAARYRDVLGFAQRSVAVANAALALGDLAVVGANVTAHVEAAQALAMHTSCDPLAASLQEQCGWLLLLAAADHARAAPAFAAALERSERSLGAVLGRYLASTGDPSADPGARLPELAAACGGELGAALELRASSRALVRGERELAERHIEAARALGPGVPCAIWSAAETYGRVPLETSIGSGATDRWAARATVLELRAALAEDRRHRSWWLVEHAEALALAGDLRRALEVLATMVDEAPTERRALRALRRIAARAADRVREAQACYALAQLTRDAVTKLALLREAVAVYDSSGPGGDVELALTIYRQIVALERDASEADRLLELLRERRATDALIAALSDQLDGLALEPSAAPRCRALLRERAELLRDSGQDERARADLEALDRYGHDVEVDPLRAESAAAAFQAPAMEPSIRAWGGEEPTASPTPAAHSGGATTALQSDALEDTAVGDGLGDTTARANPAELATEERRVARAERAARMPRASRPGASTIGTTDPPKRGDTEPALRACERELAYTTNPALQLELHLEAGHIAEALACGAEAVTHYTAALRLDPTATAALYGLRRCARVEGNHAEVDRLLEIELQQTTSQTERVCVARYLLDLRLARGEHDAAARALDELATLEPAEAPELLLARLEVALAGARGSDVNHVFERLAVADDPDLRSTAQLALAVLGVRDADSRTAAHWWAAAAASPAASLALKIQSARYAATGGDADPAAVVLLDVAHHVERDDPSTAAALAIRSQSWATPDSEAGRETIAAAAQLAARAAARDPLVCRIAAEASLLTAAPETAAHLCVRWSRVGTTPVERAYAAARAAELAPERFAKLWRQVLDLDPGNDHAAAQLRRVYETNGTPEQVIDLELAIGREVGSDAAVLRVAHRLLALAEPERAIEILAGHPPTWPIREALADAYAAAEAWDQAARVLEALSSRPGLLSRQALAWRCAHAWTTAADEGDPAARIPALDAWARVLADDPAAPVAHGIAITIATALQDPAILGKIIMRARAAERSPWAAASLGLRHARAVLAKHPRLASGVAATATGSLADPRGVVIALIAAGQSRELANAIPVLERRAQQREGAGAAHEPVMLRVRAALLALDAGDGSRARALLASVQPQLGAVAELLAEQGGTGPSAPPAARPPSCLSRSTWDAENAERSGQHERALELYIRAWREHARHPIAELSAVRLATRLEHREIIREIAHEQLRSARASGSCRRELAAWELTLAGDLLDAETLALLEAQPVPADRGDLALRLELQAAARGLAPRSPLLACDGLDWQVVLGRALTALRQDVQPDLLAGHWRMIVARSPRDRIALLHLELLALDGGPSEELAELEERIASLADDRIYRAAFLCRVGETLATLGRTAEAVARFADAARLAPNYEPALELWRYVALAGELWIEAANAAAAQAERAADDELAGTDHHFAAVLLMDRAHDPEAAMQELARALEADPRQLDALVRLRMLPSPTARELYAAALDRGIAVHEDTAVQIELRRMRAELLRANGSLDEAIAAYRSVLALDPAEPRALAAIADCAIGDADPRRSIDAILARIAVERDVHVLGSLHHRLGAAQMALGDTAAACDEFRRALACVPDDSEALRRLLDLAVARSEWADAANVLDRLLATAQPLDERVHTLRRGAQVYMHGFDDAERAAALLDCALDAAPTDVEAIALLADLYSADRHLLVTRLDAISATMRASLELELDPAAARMLSHAMLTRATIATETTAASPRRIARTAAELADILGVTDPVLRRSLEDPGAVDPSVLSAAAVDGCLFAGAGAPQMRELLRALAAPIAELFNTDVAKHGVSRKDRVASSHELCGLVTPIASALGLKDPHIYVSTSHPLAAVIEPTRPPALVLGAALVADPRLARFAAGATLKLAQLALAIPARLPTDELAALAAAVISVVDPARPAAALPPRARTFAERLRRITPAKQLQELAGLAPPALDALALARDLRIAGLRAGIIASGSLYTCLHLLALAANTPIDTIVHDPIVRELVNFALTEIPALRW